MDRAENVVVAAKETCVDYAQTAALGTAAFDNPRIQLDGEHLKWFYEKSFSQGSTVIALRADGQKVGQIAMVRQTVMIAGKKQAAAQLVDLFIEKKYRGRRALAFLYAEVEQQFLAQEIRFAFGMPNARAVGVNEHFFQLKEYLALQVRVGVSLPIKTSNLKKSFRFSAQTRSDVVELGNQFATSDVENGLKWEGDRLFNRLCGKNFEYALHASENLLLISSPRHRRNMPFTLLCGFFCRQNTPVTAKDIDAVTRSACSTWGRPLFIYAGHHLAMPFLPGIPVAKKLRHSPMILQVRDFTPDVSAFQMDRFQSIDWDFA